MHDVDVFSIRRTGELPRHVIRSWSLDRQTRKVPSARTVSACLARTASLSGNS